VFFIVEGHRGDEAATYDFGGLLKAKPPVE